MSERFTEEQINELRESFNLIDKDGDGIIPIVDLEALLGSFWQNIPEVEFRQMINEFDANESGVINFDGFLKIMLKGGFYSNQEDELYEAFKVFDRDGVGLISPDDLKEVINS